jgi:hypothetical protein
VGEAVHAEREKGFLLARPEQKVLEWLASRLPRRVLPDDLTLVGVLAAVGISLANQASNTSSH